MTDATSIPAEPNPYAVFHAKARELLAAHNGNVVAMLEALRSWCENEPERASLADIAIVESLRAVHLAGGDVFIAQALADGPDDAVTRELKRDDRELGPEKCLVWWIAVLATEYAYGALEEAVCAYRAADYDTLDTKVRELLAVNHGPVEDALRVLSVLTQEADGSREKLLRTLISGTE